MRKHWMGNLRRAMSYAMVLLMLLSSVAPATAVALGNDGKDQAEQVVSASEKDQKKPKKTKKAKKEKKDKAAAIVLKKDNVGNLVVENQNKKGSQVQKADPGQVVYTSIELSLKGLEDGKIKGLELSVKLPKSAQSVKAASGKGKNGLSFSKARASLSHSKGTARIRFKQLTVKNGKVKEWSNRSKVELRIAHNPFGSKGDVAKGDSLSMQAQLLQNGKKISLPGGAVEKATLTAATARKAKTESKTGDESGEDEPEPEKDGAEAAAGPEGQAPQGEETQSPTETPAAGEGSSGDGESAGETQPPTETPTADEGSSGVDASPEETPSPTEGPAAGEDSSGGESAGETQPPTETPDAEEGLTGEDALFMDEQGLELQMDLMAGLLSAEDEKTADQLIDEALAAFNKDQYIYTEFDLDPDSVETGIVNAQATFVHTWRPGPLLKINDNQAMYMYPNYTNRKIVIDIPDGVEVLGMGSRYIPAPGGNGGGQIVYQLADTSGSSDQGQFSFQLKILNNGAVANGKTFTLTARAEADVRLNYSDDRADERALHLETTPKNVVLTNISGESWRLKKGDANVTDNGTDAVTFAYDITLDMLKGSGPAAPNDYDRAGRLFFESLKVTDRLPVWKDKNGQDVFPTAYNVEMKNASGSFVPAPSGSIGYNAGTREVSITDLWSTMSSASGYIEQGGVAPIQTVYRIHITYPRSAFVLTPDDPETGAHYPTGYFEVDNTAEMSYTLKANGGSGGNTDSGTGAHRVREGAANLTVNKYIVDKGTTSPKYPYEAKYGDVEFELWHFETVNGQNVPTTRYKGPQKAELSGGVFKAQFSGIASGNYLLVESKAPEGFLPMQPALLGFVSGESKVQDVVNPFELFGTVQVKKLGQTVSGTGASPSQPEAALPGVVFKLTQVKDANGQTPAAPHVVTATTDSAGIAFFDKVPNGTYALTEESVPSGYQLDSSFSRQIVVNGNQVKTGFGTQDKIVNRQNKGRIQLKKVDGAGNVVKSPASFGFRIYLAEGFAQAADGTVTGGTPVGGEFSPNSSGLAYSGWLDVLDASGNPIEYVLVETKTHSEYDKDPAGKHFYLTGNGQADGGALNSAAHTFNYGNFVNGQKGWLQIKKSKKDIGANGSVSTGNHAGVVFDVLDQNGNALSPARIITTGTDGIGRIQLPAGTYTLKEREVAGYLPDSANVYGPIVVADNQTTRWDTGHPFVNNQQKGLLQLTKFVKDTHSGQPNKAPSGKKITLRVVRTHDGQNNPLSPATSQDHVITLGANGLARLVLEVGKYTITEIGYDDAGYMVDKRSIDVTITALQTTVLDEASKSFVNLKKPWVKLTKNTWSPASGGSGTVNAVQGTSTTPKFTVYRQDPNGTDLSTLGANVPSGQTYKGTALTTFNHGQSVALELGLYYILEDKTSVPSGYIWDNTVHVVDLSGEDKIGTETAIVADNLKNKGRLSVKKADYSGTNPLKGATFSVYKGEPGKPGSQKVGGTVTTDANGIGISGELDVYELDANKRPGAKVQYWIYEETPPEGYLVSEPRYIGPVELNEIALVSGTYKFTFTDKDLAGKALQFNNPAKGVIDLNKLGYAKRNEALKKPLPGVTFGLFKKETGNRGTLVDIVTTDAFGNASFANVNIEEDYYVVELAITQGQTQAGYLPVDAGGSVYGLPGALAIGSVLENISGYSVKAVDKTSFAFNNAEKVYKAGPLQFLNEIPYTRIEIRKTGLPGGEPVTGAQFRLFVDRGDGRIVELTGTPGYPDYYETFTDGLAHTESLDFKVGHTYYIYESKPGFGYKVPDGKNESHEVHEANGQVTTLQGYWIRHTLTNADRNTTVSVHFQNDRDGGTGTGEDTLAYGWVRLTKKVYLDASKDPVKSIRANGVKYRMDIIDGAGGQVLHQGVDTLETGRDERNANRPGDALSVSVPVYIAQADKAKFDETNPPQTILLANGTKLWLNQGRYGLWARLTEISTPDYIRFDPGYQKEAFIPLLDAKGTPLSPDNARISTDLYDDGQPENIGRGFFNELASSTRFRLFKFGHRLTSEDIARKGQIAAQADDRSLLTSQGYIGPLDGAAFTLYKIVNGQRTPAKGADGQNIQVQTSGGVFLSPVVEPGEYVIVENAAPNGYTKGYFRSEYRFTVESGTLSEVYISNQKVSRLVIKKFGENQSEPLQGAKFQIYTENPLDGQGNIKSDAKKLSNGLIDMTGAAEAEKLLSGLAIGTYYIAEIQAPAGRYPETDANGLQKVYTFTVTAEHQEIVIHAFNPKTVSAFLKKVDTLSGSGLAGAKFALYENRNGAFVLVRTDITSGAAGRIELTGLKQNTQYKLVETQVPGDVYIAQNLPEIQFATQGVDLDLTQNAQNDIPNTQKGALVIRKFRQDLSGTVGADPDVQPMNANVVFEVYQDDGNGAPDLTKKAAEVTYDAAVGYGYVRLPAGVYHVKEKGAPTGYLPAEGTVKVTVSNDKTHEMVLAQEDPASGFGEDAADEPARVLNTQRKAGIRIFKQSQSPSDGPATQNGAEFTLYDGQGAEAGKLVIGQSRAYKADGSLESSQAAQDGEGILTLWLPEGVKQGTYTLRETKPAPGYALPDNPADAARTVVLTASRWTDDPGTLTFTDPKEGRVVLSKFNNMYGHRLAALEGGFGFTLYRQQPDGTIAPVDGEQFTGAAGAELGKITWSALSLSGTYFVRETTPKAGYELDSIRGAGGAAIQPVTKTLTGGGEISVYPVGALSQDVRELTIAAYNRPQGLLVIEKQDDKGQPIVIGAGQVHAQFEVYQSLLKKDELTDLANLDRPAFAAAPLAIGGSTVVTLNQSGRAEIAGLDMDYVYRLVEIKSAPGYTLDEEINPTEKNVWFEDEQVSAMRAEIRFVNTRIVDARPELTIDKVNAGNGAKVDIFKESLYLSDVVKTFRIQNLTAQPGINKVPYTEYRILDNLVEMWHETGAQVPSADVRYAITGLALEAVPATYEDEQGGTVNVLPDVKYTWSDGAVETIAKASGTVALPASTPERRIVGVELVYADGANPVGRSFTVKPIDLTFTFYKHAFQSGRVLPEIDKIQNTAKVVRTADVKVEDGKSTSISSEDLVSSAVLEGEYEIRAAKAAVSKAMENLTGPTDPARETGENLSGDRILFTLTAQNVGGAADAPLVNPIVIDELDENLNLALSQDNEVVWTQSVPAGISLVGKPRYYPVETANGKIKEYVVWNFEGQLLPGETITITYEAIIDEGINNDIKLVKNDVYLTSGEKLPTTQGNPYGASFTDGNGNLPGEFPSHVLPGYGGEGGHGYAYLKDSVQAELNFRNRVDLIKYVRGADELGQYYWRSSERDHAITTQNGNLDYRIRVDNNSNVALTDGFALGDILPHKGDKILYPSEGNRNTVWDERPILDLDAGPISVSGLSGGYQIWYYVGSATGSALAAKVKEVGEKASEGKLSELSLAGDSWTTSPSVNAIAFVIVAEPGLRLEPGQGFTIQIEMKAPALGYDDVLGHANKLANNDAIFGYRVDKQSPTRKLPVINSNVVVAEISTEPVKMGNRVWLDKNHNGIQDEGEPGVNGAEVILYTERTDGMGAKTKLIDKYAQTANGADPLGYTDGLYLFDKLAPSVLQNGRYLGSYYEYQVQVNLPEEVTISGNAVQSSALGFTKRYARNGGVLPAQPGMDESPNIANRLDDSNVNNAGLMEKTVLYPADGSNVPYDLTFDGGLILYRTIKFKKVDQAGRIIPGAQFELTGGTNDASGGEGYGPAYGTQPRTATSGADGYVVFEKVPYFGTYTITETVAPSGYDPIVISVPMPEAISGQLYQKTYLVDLGPQVNRPGIGRLQFDKKDVTNKTHKIPNVAFVLQAVALDADSNSFITGTPYKDAFNGAAGAGKAVVESPAGTYALDNLLYGEYLLTETQAGEGYHGTGMTWVVKISKTGQQILPANVGEEELTGSGEIYNRPMLTGLELTKVDSLSGKALSGVTFTLHAVSLVDGSEDAFNGVDNTGVVKVTGAAGKAVFTGLKFGTYTLTETLKSGYKNPLTATVVVDENGAAIQGVEGNVVENEPILTDLELIKVDSLSGNPLEGVTFTLHAVSLVDGSEDAFNGEDNTGMAQVTGADGRAAFTGLKYGTYTLTETLKSGYKNPLTATVVVDENGAVIQGVEGNVVENEPILTDLELTKVDSQTGRPLSDVTFVLAAVKLIDGSEDLFNQSGAVKPRQTGENGQLSFAGLKFGTYTLTETASREGYYLTQQAQFTVVVDENGATIQGVTENVVTNEPISGTVKVLKVDSITGESLAGAVFVLEGTDINGNPIRVTVTTDENGEAVFDMVPYGDYVLEETEAPLGYLIDDANPRREIRIRLENPETGDKQHWEETFKDSPEPEPTPTIGLPTPTIPFGTVTPAPSKTPGTTPTKTPTDSIVKTGQSADLLRMALSLGGLLVLAGVAMLILRRRNNA